LANPNYYGVFLRELKGQGLLWLSGT